MGGGSKKFLHLLKGGSKSFGGLRRGGQKSLMTKIFNCPAPHQSIYEHSLKTTTEKESEHRKAYPAKQLKSLRGFLIKNEKPLIESLSYWENPF